MKETVIRVNNLSKSYRMYSSPADKLKELLHPLKKKYHKDFWAIRDVSFEVKKGECVGIVGRNGSGKSTLLKLICGILQPTAGDVQVAGRISALLELGAGFNPEFTGRENVFMNGAVLGFDRKNMEGRFNEIAAFADIGDFIDQPVKVYSSGMYARLAFAIAINVDPDILIVDEALSVGDEAFQRKCFSRINSIRKNGATVFFVSHGVATVVELCNHVMLFDQGEMLMAGNPKAVTSRYQMLMYAPPEKLDALRKDIRSLAAGQLSAPAEPAAIDRMETSEGEVQKPSPAQANASAPVTAHAQAPKKTPVVEDYVQRAYYDPNLSSKSVIAYESRGAVIENPKITTPEGEQVNVLLKGKDYIYSYSVRFKNTVYGVVAGAAIKTVSGVELGWFSLPILDAQGDCVEKGAVIEIKFPFKCILMHGSYFINAGVRCMKGGELIVLHRIVDALMFQVQIQKGVAGGIVDFSSAAEPDVKFALSKGERNG